MVEFATPSQSPKRKVSNGDFVPHGDDNELFVLFYKNAVTGLDHLKLEFPGDKYSTYDQPVKDKDKVRFAQAWHAYQNQLESFPGQTRVEEVVWLDESTRNSLRAVGVFTVEQLAATIDGNLQGLGMGARALRDKAMRHVADKQAIERASTIDQEKADMQRRLDEMQAQIEALKAPPEKGKAK